MKPSYPLASYRTGISRLLRAAFLLSIMLGVCGANARASRATLSIPTLHVTAPQTVAVGEPISLVLTVLDATDIGGYEATLLFNTSAAHFSGLQQRDNDLAQRGRDIGPLGAVELPQGIAIGFYSCPAQHCNEIRRDRAGVQGEQGKLKLATVAIVPDRPGILEIRLTGAKFVDASGALVPMAGADQLLVVQVGPPGESTRFVAPQQPWSLANTPSSASSTLDLTGDGSVTHSDVLDAALAWMLARETGTPCTTPLTRSTDVNRDGCIDVADLQTIAAHYSSAGSQRGAADHWIYLPLISSNKQRTPQVEPTFRVNSVGDEYDTNNGDGICATATRTCTLRAAITEANLHPGADTIAFAIPGTGVHTIQLRESLPIINDQSGPTTIDGYTQPGAQPNNDPVVSNAAIKVQISGGVTIDALLITSPNNVVRGLAFYQLRRPFLIYGHSALNNKIVGNFVGTDAAGNYIPPDYASWANGIVLAQGASRNWIGTPAPADRNVISGNGQNGVVFFDENTNANMVVNNLIGLGPLGNKRVRNMSHGVDINSHASYNIIGGTNPGERNVISGNGGEGVEISHGVGTIENKVIGNFIGTDVTGSSAPVYTLNGYHGVHIEDGVRNNTVSGNVIGNSGSRCCNRGGIEVVGALTSGNRIMHNRVGISLDGRAIANNNYGIQVRYGANHTQIGPGNIIAYNPIGIAVRGSDSPFNTITQNAIFGNNGRGIELHSGANQQLKPPILQLATLQTVAGTACLTCTVEVFVADRAITFPGQGKLFIGAASVQSNGRFTANVNGVAAGDYVTAVAIDAAGNSSEFALNLRVTDRTLPPNTYAADDFTRSATDSWQSADVGGVYSYVGATADFDVAGGGGTMLIPGAGMTRAAYLRSVSLRDVEASFRVRSDKLAMGSNQYVYFVARQATNGAEYRVKIRFATNGAVYLQATRATTAGETAIGTETRVTTLTHQAGQFIWVRGEITGANPTTLRIKAWLAGQAEPTAWHYTATDTAQELQGPGAIGLRAYISSASSNAPVLFTFDDLLVIGGN